MNRFVVTLALSTLLLGFRPGVAEEKLPADARITKLVTHPASVEIGTPFEYAQLVVTAELADGDRIDVTRIAKITAPECVVVDDRGQVQPKADGKGGLLIAVGDKTSTVPVSVSGQKEQFEVSFKQDVMPILSRMGCNAGTCHGSAKGKNGFKLSLRGYDPESDHLSLTDDLEGRRFNRAAPDQSLMLLKTSGTAPHEGGVLTSPGEPYYELIRSWVAAGAKLDKKSPRVISLSVYPQSVVIPLPEMKQQMAIYAKFADGTTRDVTSEAFLESSNNDVAKTERPALVNAFRRGEATMLARYEGAYAAAKVIVMGDRDAFAWQETPEYNKLDTLVYQKLRQIKVLPSDVCTDAEFLRRVYLDLTGLPPTPEQVHAFLADKRPTREKRDAMVDTLVGSPEYIEHWTNKWADLLQVNRKFLGVGGAQKLREYIRKAVAENMAYDEFAYSILTESGSTLDKPAASYYKILRSPEEAMENTTHLFLAIRFNCNKCHDHPFERWTQNQYYELSAYFAQIGRKEDPRYKGKKIPGSAVEKATPLVEIISDVKAGDVKHQRTGEVVEPTFPFTHEGVSAKADASRRVQLAKWITSPKNPYFAKSYVNRLWSYLLGVGIIEPIDDIRAGNPPSNPELLDYLTEEFLKNGFDAQHVLKLICKSRTYQHSIVSNRWNRDDETNYARALPRRLPAEVLYDSIHRATGSQSRLPGLPPGTRAASLLDSSVDAPGSFFVLFGKPPRESACECERVDGMMLAPVLALVNGPVIADAIKDPNNRIAKIVQGEKDPKKIVERIYLAILCRPPTEQELAFGIESLKLGEEDYTNLVAEHKRRADTLAAYEKTLDAKQAQWEASLKTPPVWNHLEVIEAKSEKGAVLKTQPDGSILVSGKNPPSDRYTIKARGSMKGLTGLRLEAMTDKSLPKNGPGRAPNGNFVLSYIQVDAKETTGGTSARVQLANPQADFSQTSFSPAQTLRETNNRGWAISPQMGKPHQAYYEFKKTVDFNQPEFTITLVQKHTAKNHTLGKFRFSVTTAKRPFSLKPLPAVVTKALNVEPAKRTPQQKSVLQNHFRSQDAELARLKRQVEVFPMPTDKRLPGARDLTWALLNSKAFLFNR